MYKVIVQFYDLQAKRTYLVGDLFPHNSVSAERIKELASDQNRLQKPLIELVEEKPKASRRKTKKEEG